MNDPDESLFLSPISSLHVDLVLLTLRILGLGIGEYGGDMAVVGYGWTGGILCPLLDARRLPLLEQSTPEKYK
jgi:hypothetical protein